MNANVPNKKRAMRLDQNNSRNRYVMVSITHSPCQNADVKRQFKNKAPNFQKMDFPFIFNGFNAAMWR